MSKQDDGMSEALRAMQPIFQAIQKFQSQRTDLTKISSWKDVVDAISNTSVPAPEDVQAPDDVSELLGHMCEVNYVLLKPGPDRTEILCRECHKLIGILPAGY